MPEQSPLGPREGEGEGQDDMQERAKERRSGQERSSSLQKRKTEKVKGWVKDICYAGNS